MLGNLLEYRSDHLEVFQRGYRTLGSMFSVRLGPQRGVVLIGAEHNRFFFSQVDKILSVPEVYRFVIPMFGPVLNAAEDVDVRRGHLGLLHSAFRSENMQAYLDVMVRETTAWLDGLGEAGTFELYDEMAVLAMNIATSALMGPAIRAKMAEFRPLFDDLARGMDFVLPPNLPLPRFRRRDRARRKLLEMIGPIIAERRARNGQPDDFLNVLCCRHDLDGSAVPAATAADLALMTIFTAYIATAAQTSWALVHLLQHRAYFETVLAEQDAVLGDPADPNLTIEALGRLERLQWALMESQRLNPVMTHYARYNKESYELGGYHVPRGWLTMVCPAISQRLPELFSEPDVYDPERFAPGRAEHLGHPYGLIGFGAGVYRCPGASFGTIEMKVLLTLLIRRFAASLRDQAPGRNHDMGVVRPTPPCTVEYARRRARVPSMVGA